MGMDVNGKNPDSEVGEYFQNNVWHWHSLWDYCCEIAPELTSKVKYGHFNDGDGLNVKDSKALSIILKQKILSGECAEDVKQYQARMDAMPDEPCDHCDSTGKVDGKPCRHCEGKGSKRPFATWYDLTVQNISDFAEFLEHCGGFEIR